MKLTIPRGPLHAALTQANRIVERRNTVPVLSNVRLAAAEGRLSVTGTDLDIEARVTTEAGVERPGETTAPSALLTALVGKMAEGLVTLDLADGGATMTVRSGRTRATLQCLPASDFPELVAGAFDATFAFGATDLVEALEATGFAISTEETRYYLNGVFLDPTGDKLVIVATDGHRLSRWRGPLPEGAAAAPAVIVPRKTVGEIHKIAREAAKDGAPQVAVAVSEHRIRFEIAGTILTSTLINGTFPDYSRVIPGDPAATVALEAEALSSAVDRVMQISSERGRAIKCGFDGDLLRLDVTSADFGSASEEMPARPIEGQPKLEIGFNGRYLGDVVAALGSETLVARLPADPGSPMVFVPEPETTDGRDRLIVLMPMRV